MDTGKISFFSKNPVTCPVCETTFYREELHTGRGRLVAGKLSDELRREYEPSKKYGEVFPLVYPVNVCPSCLYAAYQKDFNTIDEATIQVIETQKNERRSSAMEIFPPLDYTSPRRLYEGAASYYFAIMSYDHMDKKHNPTFKQGLSALRAAWICNDLHKKYPGENWDYIALIFYRKARFFYQETIQRETTGKEGLQGVSQFGPGTDKNFGYDGVLYIAGLLEYKYGPTSDTAKRTEAMKKAKITIARVHGMGKASKNKPSVLINLVKDLHKEIGELIKEEENKGA